MPIGSWVMGSACAQLAAWPAPVTVSGKLAHGQVTPQLVDETAGLIARHAVRPGRLVLEITESIVLDPRSRPIAADLRSLGVQMALGAFGAGYSSLGSMQRFPMDMVKLDRALGLRVVAEGIESRAQLDLLRDLDCPLGQGFLFARPMPVDEARGILPSPRPPPPGA